MIMQLEFGLKKQTTKFSTIKKGFIKIFEKGKQNKNISIFCMGNLGFKKNGPRDEREVDINSYYKGQISKLCDCFISLFIIFIKGIFFLIIILKFFLALNIKKSN